MEQSTSIILALYALVGIMLATLWLRHQSVLRQRDEMRTKLGNLQGNLASTSNRLDLLSRGVDTILGEYVKANSIDIVLNKKNIIMGKNSFNITEEILKKVNELK